MTPRPDLTSLLAACKADPEDDDRRLVLADALEEYGDEHGRARADLVRTQVREAGWLSPATEVRLRGLLRRHAAAWLGPLAPTMAYVERDLTLHRKGLVKCAVISELMLRTPGLAASECWAWVEMAGVFLHPPVAMERIIDSGLLRTVCNLWLTDRLTAPLASALFADGVLGDLYSLELAESFLVEKTLNAVLRSPCAANLRVLRVDAYKMPLFAKSRSLASLRELTICISRNVDPISVAPLAQRQNLAGVRRLHVSGSPLGPEGARGLLGGPAFQELTRLDLARTGCQPEDSLALALSPRLTELTDLFLSDNAIGDEGAANLAQSPNLRRLTALDLRNNAIGERGILALASSPALATVQSLDLSGNALGSEGCQALARAPMPALRRLNLDACEVGVSGLQELARAPWLGRLQQLSLANNAIAAAGLAAFLAGCASLEAIDLSGNRLRAEGAEAVAACPQLARLCELNLAGNRMGDAGMRHLAASAHLSRDVRLILVGNGVPSAATAGALRERFGQGSEYFDAFVPDVE